MRKTGVAVFVALLLGCSLLAADEEGQGEKILKFSTMAGVTGAFVGAANPVRNVGGGGIPWTLKEAHGELRVDGRLKIEVKGLVLATTNTNPQANFRAVVSCLTSDQTTTPATTPIVNVLTEPFPATTAGDARLETTVSLPTPCVAPVIFVTTGAGAVRWFAATGF